jgi:hypothetical protein
MGSNEAAHGAGRLARANHLRWALLLLATAGCNLNRCGRTETRTALAAQDAGTSEQKSMTGSCPQELLAARRGGSDADRYVVPSEAERLALRRAVGALIGGGADARAEASRIASTIDFEVVDVADLPGTLLLREIGARRRGGGAYLIRIGTEPRTRPVIQAPHTFFDEGTLPLACDLFLTARAQALFIETVHRYKGAAPDQDGAYPADVAHAPDSFFQAATEELLVARPSVTIVQLHGFAARDGSLRGVVSNGSRTEPDPAVDRVAAALGAVAGSGIRSFPRQANELGGTGNVQGAAVRGAGGHFVHVELEASLRRELLGNAELRRRFVAALAGALGEK